MFNGFTQLSDPLALAVVAVGNARGVLSRVGEGRGVKVGSGVGLGVSVGVFVGMANCVIATMVHADDTAVP